LQLLPLFEWFIEGLEGEWQEMPVSPFENSAPVFASNR